MNTAKRYRFYLEISRQGNTYTYEVHPAYKGLSLQYSKSDDDNVFMQRSMDAEFTFYGNEFDIIMGGTSTDKFTLTAYDIKKEKNRFTGTFRRLNGEVDYNHKTFRTKINPNDDYNAIESHKGDEYDIIKIASRKTGTVDLVVLPMYQIFEVGGDKVYLRTATGLHKADLDMNGYSTSYYEDTCHFGHALSVAAHSDNSTVPGNWIGNGGWFDTSRNYVLQSTSGQQTSIRINQDALNTEYKVYLTFNGTEYEATKYRMAMVPDTGVDTDTLSTLIFLYKGGFYAYFTVTDPSNPFRTIEVRIHLKAWMVMSRMVFSGSEDLGYAISLNDYVRPAIRYTRCAPKNFFYTISDKLSNEPTQWGQIDGEELWYDVPDSVEEYTEVSKERWYSRMGVYMRREYVPQSDVFIQQGDIRLMRYASVWKFADAYNVMVVVKALLAQIDPTLIFELDGNHSHFFMNDLNPITGTANRDIYMTHKTNLNTFRYDRAAWKNPITLEKMLYMLKTCFGVRYDIYQDQEGKRHFRIEHLDFYRSGYSYSGQDTREVYDLAKRIDASNSVPYSFCTARYSHNNVRNAITEYDYRWDDEVNGDFGETAVTIPPQYRYADGESKKTLEIDQFNADIDNSMFPEDVDSDGYYIFSCYRSGSNKDLVVWKPLTRYHYSGGTTTTVISYLQNAEFTFDSLVSHYKLYDIYGEKVVINDTEYDVVRTPMIRSLSVKFPLLTTEDIDCTCVVNTELGIGTPNEMTIDLSNDAVEAELVYEITD